MTYIKSNKNTNEKNWRTLFITGAVTTVIVLAGIFLDVIVGSVTGGNLSAVPQTASEKFTELHNNPALGLYNLDLLNLINQLLLIPGYLALFAAHRKTNTAFASLALIVFLTGTVIFVTTNTALPMLELSNRFFATTSEQQKVLLAAGEAMLARGLHGSLGVFIGFVLPNIAGIIMSLVMWKERIFSRTTAFCGISGSTLLVVYLLLVTFIPAVKKTATMFALPGGLLTTAWMILFTLKLFQLGRQNLPLNHSDAAAKIIRKSDRVILSNKI